MDTPDQSPVNVQLNDGADFADLQTAFIQAAQEIQARDTRLIPNGAPYGPSPLAIRRFSEDLYIISGYRLPDPQTSEVSKRIQRYQQNPLIEAHEPGTYTVLSFQHGPIAVDAAGGCKGNGITIEALLQVAMDRLEYYQNSPYACDENGKALDGIQTALAALQSRAERRLREGVLNTNTEEPAQEDEALQAAPKEIEAGDDVDPYDIILTLVPNDGVSEDAVTVSAGQIIGRYKLGHDAAGVETIDGYKTWLEIGSGDVLILGSEYRQFEVVNNIKRVRTGGYSATSHRKMPHALVHLTGASGVVDMEQTWLIDALADITLLNGLIVTARDLQPGNSLSSQVNGINPSLPCWKVKSVSYVDADHDENVMSFWVENSGIGQMHYFAKEEYIDIGGTYVRASTLMAGEEILLKGEAYKIGMVCGWK